MSFTLCQAAKKMMTGGNRQQCHLTKDAQKTQSASTICISAHFAAQPVLITQIYKNHKNAIAILQGGIQLPPLIGNIYTL